MITVNLLPDHITADHVRGSLPFHVRLMAAYNAGLMPTYDRPKGYVVQDGKGYTTRNRAIRYGAKIS